MQGLYRIVMAAGLLAGVAACGNGGGSSVAGQPDSPAVPGSSGGAGGSGTPPGAGSGSTGAKTRYAMNNQCWAIRANGNGKYLVVDGASYAATAASASSGEPFFLKPSALGKYLVYDHQRMLLTVASAPALGQVGSANATDDAEWTVIGVGDTTTYPPTPQYNVEPTPAEVATYYDFVDPELTYSDFTMASGSNAGQRLTVEPATGALALAAPGATANQSFSFEPAKGCAAYPEASSDFAGIPFKGTQPDGSVLGHADVHVHISATTFLGGAHWGQPYNKFGVEHALGNCAVAHGPTGQLDLLGGVFTQDVDGHATDGWPTFTDWPSRDNLTHEAIYWKWVERAWAAGLRVIVNDLVDNETLCELERNANQDPTRDCNSMDNAGQQVGTMYGMQDYIDAQYGGRGKGFFQIVHSPAEARQVIEDGHIAVILGVEISELFNCKVNYKPTRSQEPYQEDGSGVLENSYACTMEEGKPNSILTQIQRVHDWGVRQLITIHEFDNAFGGNGIFDGLILNLGNREDTGGIPSGNIDSLLSLITPNTDPTLAAEFLANLPTTETPTGEWWTTYDCPTEASGSTQGTPGFSGYLWGSSGGAVQSYLTPEDNGCIYLGQGGRHGGVTPCYPKSVPQCNARWMTPIGQYTYEKLMEMGFIIDFDHMTLGMKGQLLDLAEAQSPAYPLVSTHGTFGGTSVQQATRVLKDGGFLYPSIGSSKGFLADMDETRAIYDAAMAQRVAAGQSPLRFGFGYGTDTNGLSAQSGPRGQIAAGHEVKYPFTLFSGAMFDQLSAFDSVEGVIFLQPSSRDADGNVKRTWNEDQDGNAQYGMLSDIIQEMRLDGRSDQIADFYNSAEVYLDTWERTEAASAAISAHGIQVPSGLLRPAPSPTNGVASPE